MQKNDLSDRIFDIVNIVILVLVLLVVLYPLIFVVSASVSDPILVNQGKVWLIPKGINFEGYERVFRNSEIVTGYRNTVFYTVFGTLINLFVTLTCAYSLSRKDLRGRGLFMALFTFTMFFSGGLIPTFILVKNLGLYNTIWALVLPNAAAMYNIIVARTYMQVNIPLELQEAAFIDGCSNTRLFLKIVMPLSAPIIAVTALFYGVSHWNSFFNALIYLSNRSLFPLQLIIREILIESQMSAQMITSGGNIEAMAEQARIAEIVKYAVIIVSTVPVLIVYPFLQRYFTQGIMVGALKG
ncbi:MAG: sugar ABC transporter permease [Clostridiales bacterium GWC2_40_7]|nr:MAG: sugar ABC transporter permease [Clostridiales bacterium GWC2_40_7]